MTIFNEIRTFLVNELKRLKEYEKLILEKQNEFSSLIKDLNKKTNFIGKNIKKFLKVSENISFKQFTPRDLIGKTIPLFRKTSKTIELWKILKETHPEIFSISKNSTEINIAEEELKNRIKISLVILQILKKVKEQLDKMEQFSKAILIKIDETLIARTKEKILFLNSLIIELDNLNEADKETIEKTGKIPKGFGKELRNTSKFLKEIEKSVSENSKSFISMIEQLRGEETEIEGLIYSIKRVLSEGKFIVLKNNGSIITIPVEIEEAKKITTCLNEIFELSFANSKSFFESFKKIAQYF